MAKDQRTELLGLRLTPLERQLLRGASALAGRTESAIARAGITNEVRRLLQGPQPSAEGPSHDRV